jgi:hypothetical protein
VIEVKRGLAPQLERGFTWRAATLSQRRLVVYGGRERFPRADGVEAAPLVDLCGELTAV